MDVVLVSEFTEYAQPPSKCILYFVIFWEGNPDLGPLCGQDKVPVQFSSVQDNILSANVGRAAIGNSAPRRLMRGKQGRGRDGAGV